MHRYLANGAALARRPTGLALAFLATVALALLAAAPAWASSPSNISTQFTKQDTPWSAQTITTLKAGDRIGYQVYFTNQNALSAQAGDTITIHGPPGTVFPTDRSSYDVGANSSVWTVVGNPTVYNEGATVTIPLAGNPHINIPPGSWTFVEIGVFDEPVRNPTTAGPYTLKVSTSQDPTPATSPPYSIVASDPANLSAVGGDGQRADSGEAFATPLSAKVVDTYGNPVQGQDVTFTAPSGGASGTFASSGSATETAKTNADGVATASAFTANSVVGAYGVQASLGALAPANFSLANNPGEAAAVSVGLDPQSIPADGTSTTTATATVTDAGGNPVSGQTVTFRSDGGQQVGPTTDNGDGTYTARVTSTTTPGSSQITATVTSSDPDLVDSATLSQTRPDATAPRVTSTAPAAGATGVGRGANVVANFSEKMGRSTISRATFKLYRCASSNGCSTQVSNVSIAKSADGLKATLNPFGTSSTLLAPKTRYKAVVTTGAKDAAGNALDQNPTQTGNQPKVWYFTTRS